MADHKRLNGPETARAILDGLPGAGYTGNPRDARAMIERIPRTLHRIWFGDSMPETFALWGFDWMRLHPDWTQMKWIESPALRGLPCHELRQRAREIIPNDWLRFQADILRLELLYVLGGVYVDMDVEPHMNIEPIVDGREVVLFRSPNKNMAGYRAITNCVMAAAPGHPFIRALIDGLPEAIEDHGHKSLPHMVGPWHIDRTYANGDWPDVTVLPWEKAQPFFTHYWNNQRRKQGRGFV